MKLNLDFQIAYQPSYLPTHPQMVQWAEAALDKALSYSDDKHFIGEEVLELTIRVVDETESAQLNFQYRGKNKPTNVLSFRPNLPKGIQLPILGDLVICAPVVSQEATRQQKDRQAHWAHLIIHGLLHLIGHDHIEPNEAEVMEGLEIKIMQELGFNNPYL